MKPNPAKILKVCVACKQSTDLDLDLKSDEFGITVDENSVNQIYETLFCDHCEAATIKLMRADGITLIDPKNITPCSNCGNPILIPRLEAQPDTNICTFCLLALEEDDPDKKHRPEPIRFDADLIPKELKQCPKCGSRTLLRKNRKTGERFIGCLAFPVCHWTSKISI